MARNSLILVTYIVNLGRATYSFDVSLFISAHVNETKWRFATSNLLFASIYCVDFRIMNYCFFVLNDTHQKTNKKTKRKKTQQKLK